MHTCNCMHTCKCIAFHFIALHSITSRHATPRYVHAYIMICSTCAERRFTGKRVDPNGAPGRSDTVVARSSLDVVRERGLVSGGWLFPPSRARSTTLVGTHPEEGRWHLIQHPESTGTNRVAENIVTIGTTLRGRSQIL